MATIETERLILRPFSMDDLDAYAALNADPEVMRHFPATMTRDEVATWIEHHEARRAARGWGPFALERKSDGALVGQCGLNEPSYPLPFSPCVEIGWRIARAFWGEGYVTEAGRAALAFGFESLGLDVVYAFTVAANARSWRVMERLGFARVPGGDFDHPMVAEGHPLRRHVLYRMTAAEWSALRQEKPEAGTRHSS